MRLVVSVLGKPNLENASYLRTLCADGLVVEVVKLDGQRDQLAEGELEAWIAGQAAAATLNPRIQQDKL